MEEGISRLYENVANKREELKKEKPSKIVLQIIAKYILVKEKEMRVYLDGSK